MYQITNLKMTEKDLVQEALQQMKNLEDVVQENAKGILGATMAQEISELVKESLTKETKNKQLNEQPEVEDDDSVETDIEVGDIAPDMSAMPELGLGDEEDDDTEVMGDLDFTDDDEDVDVYDAKMLGGDELWSLFKKMDPNNDSFIIDKDGENIHIKDDENDVEYILKMNEEMEDDMNEEMYEEMDEEMDEEMYESMDEEMDEEMDDSDEVVYEITMDEEMDEEMYESMDEEMDESMDEEIYESEDDEDDDDDDEDDDDDDDDDESVNESKKYMIKPVMGKMKNKGEAKENKTAKSATKGLKKVESKEGNYMSKPVKPTKQTKVDGFKKETLPEKGISNVKKSETKEGSFIKTPKGVGMKPGQKKFEYKEAARTYGNGSKEGRGLRKGITNNRNYVYENELLKQEVEVLKEKNEEYRKALNVFREKLNEVAVFNSNLAYATRLFTEHSTSKPEKINILRRFDDVESLKESKSLYNSIKNELSQDSSKVVTESIERRIDKTASTGSATNLIESKTYENPQFLRMKDLMSKL
jgi:hypothetical protein